MPNARPWLADDAIVIVKAAVTAVMSSPKLVRGR
jgi:hypothetical protein